MIQQHGRPLQQKRRHGRAARNFAPERRGHQARRRDRQLLQHTGRAVVFDSVEDMANRIDDPDLDVKADDVLVLRNAGPKGAPGMPEAGYLPIPRKLAQQGVKDMVRISDARMSGTAFGTIVLHITPESAIGGPLALCPQRRPDPSRRRRRADRPAGIGGGTDAPTPRMDAAARSRPSAATSASISTACCRPTSGCDFDFLLKTPTNNSVHRNILGIQEAPHPSTSSG